MYRKDHIVLKIPLTVIIHSILPNNGETGQGTESHTAGQPVHEP